MRALLPTGQSVTFLIPIVSGSTRPPTFSKASSLPDVSASAAVSRAVSKLDSEHHHPSSQSSRMAREELPFAQLTLPPPASPRPTIVSPHPHPSRSARSSATFPSTSETAHFRTDGTPVINAVQRTRRYISQLG